MEMETETEMRLALSLPSKTPAPYHAFRSLYLPCPVLRSILSWSQMALMSMWRT